MFLSNGSIQTIVSFSLICFLFRHLISCLRKKDNPQSRIPCVHFELHDLNLNHLKLLSSIIVPGRDLGANRTKIGVLD